MRETARMSVYIYGENFWCAVFRLARLLNYVWYRRRDEDGNACKLAGFQGFHRQRRTG